MWRQGEHVCIIGSTGSGKTTLARDLLMWRRYVVYLQSKTDDLIWRGFRTAKQLKDIDLTESTRWKLRPSLARQGVEFWDAMDMAYREGGWTVYMDEMYWLKHLGIEGKAVILLTQGRSEHVTCVVGVQRPAWVTRFAFSETRHFFSFGMNDDRDIVAIREITGSKEFAQEVRGLAPYQFVYLNKATGRMQRGRREDLKEILGGTQRSNTRVGV